MSIPLNSSIARLFQPWSSFFKMSHWLARWLPHSTTSWVDFKIKIKRSSLTTIHLFVEWASYLARKPVTPLYIKSSMMSSFHALHNLNALGLVIRRSSSKDCLISEYISNEPVGHSYRGSLEGPISPCLASPHKRYYWIWQLWIENNLVMFCLILFLFIATL